MKWEKTKFVVTDPLLCYGGQVVIFALVVFVSDHIFHNTWYYLLLLVLVPLWGWICQLKGWAEEISEDEE